MEIPDGGMGGESKDREIGGTSMAAVPIDRSASELVNICSGISFLIVNTKL